jgi:hypothetical protein
VRLRSLREGDRVGSQGRPRRVAPAHPLRRGPTATAHVRGMTSGVNGTRGAALPGIRGTAVPRRGRGGGARRMKRHLPSAPVRPQRGG